MTIQEIEKDFKIIGGCKEDSRAATGYILRPIRKRFYPTRALYITYTLGKSGVMTKPMFCGYE